MTFEVDKTVNYWIESAEYDLETGKNLMDEMNKVYKWLKKRLKK